VADVSVRRREHRRRNPRDEINYDHIKATACRHQRIPSIRPRIPEHLPAGPSCLFNGGQRPQRPLTDVYRGTRRPTPKCQWEEVFNELRNTTLSVVTDTHDTLGPKPITGFQFNGRNLSVSDLNFDWFPSCLTRRRPHRNVS